jgi:hypothetical protein
MEVRKHIRQGLWGILLIVTSATYIHAQSVGASFLQLFTGSSNVAFSMVMSANHCA